MKGGKEWSELVRTGLREAEVSRPGEGWERLGGVLSEPGQAPAAPVPVRKPAWRIYMPRIAAAAAVVLIGTVVGDLLLRPDTVMEQKGVVIATTEDGNAAANLPERLRRQVQLPDRLQQEEPAGLGTAAPAPRLAAAVKNDRTVAAPTVQEDGRGREIPATRS